MKKCEGKRFVDHNRRKKKKKKNELIEKKKKKSRKRHGNFLFQNPKKD